MNWTIELQETDWNCYICKTKKPSGAAAIVYLSLDTKIRVRWMCMWHKLCKVYDMTGIFCHNHEEGIDCECDEIPF